MPPLSPLYALSPIDGRYYAKTSALSAYFSEYALLKYRFKVEVLYFIFLAENNFFKLPVPVKKKLQLTADSFSIDDAELIKQTEKVTNHDIKAVEYFLKDKLKELGQEKISEWVHFGLTSQDINNTAIPMMWRDSLHDIYMPELQNVVNSLRQKSDRWKDITILARTHGQPASPTKLGKEIRVFTERLNNQLKMLEMIPHTGKFGGATGNFNAHYAAFPMVNWKKLGDRFLKEQLNLKRQQYTTQIENYDYLAAFFDNLARINTVLIDLSRDIWTYISMDYFRLKTNPKETGSSTMPHKINPIDFENAEGNLGLADAIFAHLSSKLPVSRLQRDLTDSTVLRNIGVPLAHTLIALKSLSRGLDKLTLNDEKIQSDLESNRAVISEAIQTILRRENYPSPYEKLKELTRGNHHITKESIEKFIDSLDISVKVKKELKQITPENYTGK